MFNDEFQTERLIAKSMKYEAKTIKRYYFEPSMFGFGVDFVFIYTEVFGFEFIRCSVY